MNEWMYVCMHVFFTAYILFGIRFDVLFGIPHFFWDPFLNVLNFIFSNIFCVYSIFYPLLVNFVSGTYYSPPARWGLLDFKITPRAFLPSPPPPRQLLIPLGAAGPQQPSPDINGHCWTSNRGLSSPAGAAGPQPGASRAQCAPLDLNRAPPKPSRHCSISIAR